MSAQQKPEPDATDDETAAEAPDADETEATADETAATPVEDEAAEDRAEDETVDDADTEVADETPAAADDDADAEPATNEDTESVDTDEEPADADVNEDEDAEPAATDEDQEPAAADENTEPAADEDAEPADADEDTEPAAEDADDEDADDEDADDEDTEAAAAGSTGDARRPADSEPRSRRPRGAHARRVTPRQRLRALVAPRANKTQAVIALACLLLGFALSVQVQSTSSASSFASLRQSELVSLLDRLTNRQDHLRKEISRLQQEKAALSSQNGDAARKAAQDRQDTLGILAGTEPATGPGIELTITDPHTAINAADLLNAVEELRDSGAEVMQIGSVRIGTDSYFLDTDGGVVVDGQKLVPPYHVLAIGDPHTMGTAMNIPGGVLESLHRAGAEGTVTESQSLSITAIREP